MTLASKSAEVTVLEGILLVVGLMLHFSEVITGINSSGFQTTALHNIFNIIPSGNHACQMHLR